MRELIKEMLPGTHGAFLDVGVNLGQTLMSFRSIDQERQYIGFEPNPECVAVTNRIIEINKIKDAIVIPLACADKFEISRLYHYQDSRFDSSASMVPDFRPGSRVVRESVISKGSAIECLDSIGVDRIGMVKIDVEGFEADVLEAIEPILHRDKPVVVIEVLPARTDTRRAEANKRIHELLSRTGFVSQRIIKTTDDRFDGFSEILAPGSQADVRESDYIFTFSEAISR